MLPEADQQAEITVHLLAKADGATSADVARPRALEVEDEFAPFYSEGKSGDPNLQIMPPPYSPATLERLCQQNSALGPCIDAMETNVDGTGYEVERRDRKAPEPGEEIVEDKEAARLKAFFDEVWPGVSFLSLRKRVRRDLERVGYGFVEAISNAKDDLVFLRHIQARTMRLLRLDSAVTIPVKLMRGGVEVTVNTTVRERRFVQLIGKELIYFREFGSSRQLNAKTGAWETLEAPVPFDQRATEVIYFMLHPDAGSPYGVPRWEGQIPSVLGSRRSEEHNLDFFDAGGLPPAMVLVGGGMVAEKAKTALENTFSAKGGAKHRVAVVEVQSSGGTLDKASGVDIKVERFGGDQAKDGMFQLYDANCELKIRKSFRLPPMFTGAMDGIAFASAYTGVLMAEGQVFKPERDEFDDVITRKVLPRLGAPDYVFRSKPLSIADTATKMAALQMALATQRVDGGQVVTTLNEIADLDLKVVEPPKPDPMLGYNGGPPLEANDYANPADKARPKGQVSKTELAKYEATGGVLALADETMIALRNRNLKELTKTLRLADGLAPEHQAQYRSALAVRQFLDPSMDPEGMSLLAGCTIAAIHAQGGSA